MSDTTHPPVPAAAPAPAVDDGLPAELQGKSQKEIYEILSAEHEREVQTRELEWRRSQAQAQRPVEQPAPPRPAAPSRFIPPPIGGGADEAPSILTDPDRFMDAQFQKRVEPMYAQLVQANRAANSMSFRESAQYKDLYSKYGQEIESFVDATAPQLQADIRTYQAAANWVRGTHAADLESELDARAEAKARAMLKAAGHAIPDEQPAAPPARSLFQTRTGVINPNIPASKPFDGTVNKLRLTDVERQIADGLGISEAEYTSMKEFNSTPDAQRERT